MALLRRSVTVGTDLDQLLAAACHRDLDGARSNVQVLAARVRATLDWIAARKLDPDRLPQPDPRWLAPAGAVERYRAEVADVIDRRTRALGELAAAKPPAWAVDQWGPLPDDPMVRAAWTQAAGAVMAYRERWSTDAIPTQLAAGAPPARDVARWQHWYEIGHWRDLDAMGIARHQTELDLDGTRAERRLGRDTRMERLDAALIDLHAVRADLDQQPRDPGPHIGPAPPTPEPPGPDVGL